MVMIGARLPVPSPGGEEETCAGGMQVIDAAQQTGHLTGRQDESVEMPVRGLPVSDVAGAVALPRDRISLGKDRAGHFGRGIAQRQHFETGPHLRHLSQLGNIEICYAVSPAQLALGKPLRLQRTEGLSDGHMAGLKFDGDMVLPKPGAGRNGPGNDPIREHPRNARGLGFFTCHGRPIARRQKLRHALHITGGWRDRSTAFCQNVRLKGWEWSPQTSAPTYWRLWNSGAG